MDAQRDESGRWTVSNGSESQVFQEALIRQLNALDPIFVRARASSEFEFILSLVRVRGVSLDPGWDPYETTIRAIPLVENACRAADAETQKHLALWLYGHILEADEPYELLANQVRVSGGGRFQTHCFPARSGRPQTPGQKIAQLQRMAAENGLGEPFQPLAEVWDRNLRNAAFHADYSVTRDHLRTRNPVKRYSWNEFDALVNGALAYHVAHSTLHKSHVGSYTTPVTIAIHPEFSRDPDERAIVMVREGHGVIGVKDAWSPDQLRQGKISHLLGRFTENESRLLRDDPTRALFPPENEGE
jgi:hypothetical protein